MLEHLAKLSAAGVGYKAAADAASVSRSTLSAVMRGGRRQMRADAVRRLLAVDASAMADHALVDARPSWRLIRRLMKLGFRKYELARRLGSEAKTPALQLGRRQILASKALRVERLYRELCIELRAKRDLEEHVRESTDGGREWFDGTGYSFIKRGAA